MKPLKLEFSGINSFSDKTVIDFATLTKSGIFGIFGDTGSGKSTILDCINFALYGNVERSKEKTDIINYRSNAAKVNFSFDILHDGKRKIYTVERVLKNDKNGTHKALLYENDGGNEICIADKATQVEKKIIEILGVDADDFRKCIALPQGEFAQFVKSTSGERLKLMERLFGLSKYGDSLKLKLSEILNGTENAFQNVKGRLFAYNEVTDEALRTAENGLKEKLARLKNLKARQNSVDEKCEKLKTGLQKRRELDKIKKELTALEAKVEEIEELRKGLSTLSSCREAVKLSDEIDRKSNAVKSLAEDKLRHENLINENALISDNLAKRIESENFDGEIRSCVELAVKYSDCYNKSGKLEKTLNELEAKRVQYKLTAKEISVLYVRSEKLSDELKILASAIEEKTQNDFENLLKVQVKGAVLKEEYVKNLDWFANFKHRIKDYGDDSALYEYVSCETENKISEYTRRIMDVNEFSFDKIDGILNEFERADKERESKQNEINSLREELLKIKSEIAVKEKELSVYEKEGAELRTRADEIKSELRHVFGNEVSDYGAAVTANEERLKKLQTLKDELINKRDAAKEKAASLAVSAERLNTLLLTSAHELETCKSKLTALLEENNFKDVNDCLRTVEKFSGYPDAEQAVKDYDGSIIALNARLRELENTFESDVTEENYNEALREQQDISEKIAALTGEIAVNESLKNELLRKIEEKAVIEKEYCEIEKRKSVAEKLKEITRGNKFLEFVADEYLTDISSLASSTLLNLTGGRYFLKYHDNNFRVGDNFNCGKLRGVNTLSGGETFLVSLSLALALSQTICSKSRKRIEFFFLDEGFGTLDSTLVDTVMNALEKLKSSAFTIGVISHVDELKYRIQSKITVNKATESHGSTVSASY